MKTLGNEHESTCRWIATDRSSVLQGAGIHGMIQQQPHQEEHEKLHLVLSSALVLPSCPSAKTQLSCQHADLHGQNLLHALSNVQGQHERCCHMQHDQDEHLLAIQTGHGCLSLHVNISGCNAGMMSFTHRSQKMPPTC